MKVTITGVDALLRACTLASDHGPDVAAQALYRLAEGVMTEAKVLCPVDTGALRASGHVEPPETEGTTVSVTMGFNTEYALVQHERTDYHHVVGQAKYLETPLKASAPAAAAQFRVALDAHAAQWALGRAMAAEYGDDAAG